jgi:hypothetical protein
MFLKFIAYNPQLPTSKFIHFQHCFVKDQYNFPQLKKPSSIDVLKTFFSLLLQIVLIFKNKNYSEKKIKQFFKLKWNKIFTFL